MKRWKTRVGTRVSRGEADERYAEGTRAKRRTRPTRSRVFQSRHANSRATARSTSRTGPTRALRGPYLQGRADRVHPRRRIFYDHHLARHATPRACEWKALTKPRELPRTRKKRKRQLHFAWNGVDVSIHVSCQQKSRSNNARAARRLTPSRVPSPRRAARTPVRPAGTPRAPSPRSGATAARALPAR